MQIIIKDENLTGDKQNETTLELNTEVITIKEIIEARIKKEVFNYNNKAYNALNNLVIPTEEEQILNGKLKKSKRRKIIDEAAQIEIALEAFKKNKYFVLIDSMQAECLNETVIINKNTEISFVKLTPLIGG